MLALAALAALVLGVAILVWYYARYRAGTHLTAWVGDGGTLSVACLAGERAEVVSATYGGVDVTSSIRAAAAASGSSSFSILVSSAALGQPPGGALAVRYRCAAAAAAPVYLPLANWGGNTASGGATSGAGSGILPPGLTVVTTSTPAGSAQNTVTTTSTFGASSTVSSDGFVPVRVDTCRPREVWLPAAAFSGAGYAPCAAWLADAPCAAWPAKK